MTTANLSQSTLLNFADATYPSLGTIAQLILLSGLLQTGLGFIADADTNQFTLTVPHGMVTGSRFRVSSTGTLPSPLVLATDYFVISTSATTFRLATTLANATSNTFIDLTDAGAGTLTLDEQVLNQSDSPSVLTNKELTSISGYARMALTNLGTATIVSSNAQKPVKNVLLTNNGVADINYKQIMVAFGANSTIGSATGITSYQLTNEPAIVVTPAGQSRTIAVTMQVKPF